MSALWQINAQKLSEDDREFERVIASILNGEWRDDEVSRFLLDLAEKGETEMEILGCVRAMLERISLIDPASHEKPHDVLDIGGTGGSRLGLFNISTTTAFVVAAAGIPLLKHGNRGFSSPTGSADMIEALGVKIPATNDLNFIHQCLETVGMAYLYTPVCHKFPPGLNTLRRKLGVRTIFNLAGPLSHPARLKRQMIGVSDAAQVFRFARILRAVGREKALVFFGAGGIDEISLAGETIIARLNDGVITKECVAPEDFGIESQPLSAIKGGDAAVNADICISVLNGERSAYKDATLLAAAAAFVLSDVTETWKEGVALGREVINSGQARDTLRLLREVSHDCNC